MPMQMLTVLLLCLTLLGLASPTSEARWFGGKDKKADQAAEEAVQTYQPPPVDAMELYCEPYRQEAADLYQKARYFRIAVQPYRAWLIRKHEKCKKELMEQNYLYLRHVDIQKGPSLPKIENMPGSINTPATTEPANPTPSEPADASHHD